MPTFDHDVVIIGAGAAGIAALRVLKDERLNLCMIEARPRVGGRVYSIKSQTCAFPIELGAEFIHGSVNSTWDLMLAAGARAVCATRKVWLADRGKFSYQQNYYEQIDLIFAELEGRANQSADICYGDFCKDLLERRPEVQNQVELTSDFLRSLMGSAPEPMSIKFLLRGVRAERKSGVDDYRVIDSYSQIFDAVLNSVKARMPLMLETIVRKIDWEPGFVHVAGERDGRPFALTARRCIITVPPILLVDKNAAAFIEFSPPLQKSLELIGSAKILKVVVQFAHNFWESVSVDPNDGEFLEFGYLTCLGAKIDTWWCAYPLITPVLTAFIVDQDVDVVLADSRELKCVVAESLAESFGIAAEEIESLIVAVFSHDWNSDPFSLGAYSYRLANGDLQAEELAAPIAGTLFFAGEASNTEGASGTVHGAIDTGYRAAAQVLASLE